MASSPLAHDASRMAYYPTNQAHQQGFHGHHGFNPSFQGQQGFHGHNQGLLAPSNGFLVQTAGVSAVGELTSAHRHHQQVISHQETQQYADNIATQDVDTQDVATEDLAQALLSLSKGTKRSLQEDEIDSLSSGPRKRAKRSPTPVLTSEQVPSNLPSNESAVAVCKTPEPLEQHASLVVHNNGNGTISPRAMFQSTARPVQDASLVVHNDDGNGTIAPRAMFQSPPLEAIREIQGSLNCSTSDAIKVWEKQMDSELTATKLRQEQTLKVAELQQGQTRNVIAGVDVWAPAGRASHRTNGVSSGRKGAT